MFLFRTTSLPLKKEIRSTLRNVYGISWYKSYLISNKIGFKFPFFNNNINKYYKYYLIFFLKGLIIIDSKIKRKINNNINRYLNNLSYKGLRHKLCLPVRGQRSKTNSATQRRKRKIN